MALLVNIDVPDLAAAEAFYCAAFGLVPGRRMDGFLELNGGGVPIYLLEVPAGSPAAATSGELRRYERHWCPIHPDILVDDLDAASARAVAAGARVEAPPRDAPYGRIATFGDPFGHGFCLIQMNERGYDALVA